jgi:hypothetical protein
MHYQSMMGDILMIENEPPKKNAGDIVHGLVKAGISAIPIAGAPAAEIFALVVTPPYERRRDKWIESIGNGLKKLAETVEGFKIEELSQNEAFITTITHASQAAIRNHQKHLGTLSSTLPCRMLPKKTCSSCFLVILILLHLGILQY